MAGDCRKYYEHRQQATKETASYMRELKNGVQNGAIPSKPGRILGLRV